MTPPLRAAEERRETPPSAPVVAPLAAGDARKPSPGTRLTYRGGADGHGDRGATLTDCPRCGQAVRVELHGARVSGRCYGGCPAEELLAALDLPRVADELAEMAG